jgi:hypothetical protein
MSATTACKCRCDTCLDSDCEGHICASHEPGRWIIVSPFMAHPYPTDFPDQDAAQEFLDLVGIAHFSVQRNGEVA